MPDAAGRFKGQGWSQKRSDAWERVFGRAATERELPEDRKMQRRCAEFNPLGGASRGMGRCTCPCGRGTDPGCQVHP